MTIPLLKTMQDCGDYARTVEPFISQLYELPHKALETGGSFSGLKQLYADTNPLVSGFSASIFVGSICLVVSEINRNYSQIDRLWSLLPTFYVYHIAIWARVAGLPHSRIDLVTLFSTLWSVSATTCSLLGLELTRFEIRLTSNYWRKGGYTVGSEDYRW